MSSVRWINNSRKCLLSVGLLTGANVWCFLDYQQAQMSSVCWIIDMRKCLVFVGLLTINSRKCLLSLRLLTGVND